MSLGDIIKVGKNIDFGKLYIKPAFVFIDDDGHVKLQFEADATSAMGYLYDNLCKMLGISWNYDSPSNSLGLYTACSMHAAGDRATYGCGPDSDNSGGFCPQMTIAYSVQFQSGDSAAAYLESCNSYVDYWRAQYPSGAAVGSSKFCKNGGCLGLFLNRYDLYYVFQPDLGGSWVEYNGASLAPTYSPAPTWTGGCDNPHNFHLDRCFRLRAGRSATAILWDSLGVIGQFSVFLMTFMAATLVMSIFFVRAKKRKRRNESYLSFLVRDLTKKKKKRRKKIVDRKRVRRDKRMPKDLQEEMLPRSRSRSNSNSRKQRRSPKRLNSSSKSPHRSSSYRGKSTMSTGSSSRQRDTEESSQHNFDAFQSVDINLDKSRSRRIV